VIAELLFQNWITVNGLQYHFHLAKAKNECERFTRLNKFNNGCWLEFL